MNKSINNNVTYQQYRDAAYRYSSLFGKMKREKQALEDAQTDYRRKKESLRLVNNSIDENRAERSELYDREIGVFREDWTEKKEKLDREINEEIGRLVGEANEKIREIREDYSRRSAELDKKLRPSYEQVKQYEQEIEDLRSKQNNVGDLAAEVPVENKKVQAFLFRAMHKKLLTGKQDELMNSPCDRVISGRKNLRSFEDVRNAERKFAESEWYKRLEKGDVTKTVRAKAANVLSGAAVGLFLIVFCLFFLTNMTDAGKIFQGVVMMLALGGLTANLVSFVFVKMFFGDKSRFWKNNVKNVSIIAGMLVGMGLWMASYDSSFGVGLTIVLFSLFGTFFLFRKSMITYVGLDTLGKFELMRDFARREIFREKTGEKDNPYVLQMYCYCNHNAVVDYVAMNYRDNIYSVTSQKIEMAQNCLRVANRELAKHKKELDALREMKKDRDKRIREIKARYSAAVAETKKKRMTDMPDFAEMLPEDVVRELETLDSEYQKMLAERDRLDSECGSADDRVLQNQIRSMASCKKLDEVKNTLTGWESSPTPRKTGFMLNELFCFESDKNISIIKHDLEPFVFWYHSKDKSRSPAKDLNKAMARCIKGLKKINPQALMQINIVDTVSPREDILGYESYGELSPDGLITYVKTTDRYELRLIDSRKSYKMVRALFNSQCYDIRDYLDDNSEKSSSDTEYSLAGANRLRNDEDEPFVYQVMLYVVPREYDTCDFEPPSELIRAMKDEVCVSMGIVPFFFADTDSVHEKWKEAVSLCRWSCTIGRSPKKK